ncbi:GDSL esterase/lipase At3g27950-like [Camellia sinensis]|uniref:GDSL esterase/lipase At3g27950-like n=1 Tax=Camellia sinensis TaxID=4442 RepID=UPI001036C8D1|nr:GDSL esterase/lipase At3g27950-like [Camellia sinensis]XP_028060944.1 GDSL esterase/lipase At3g27950-like [Camellia sinensis]
MDSPPVTWMFVLVVIGLIGGEMGGVKASQSCRFPAIYNFGDSNSDTGGSSSAFEETALPNGMTFFRKPSARLCDGRLIIDFIAENLKLPFLNAYLDSIGTSYRHGANFAVAGSSVLKDGGYSPFHLDFQVLQFIQFKKRTTALYNQLTNNGKKQISPCNRNLPLPNDFSKALYTVDIGQNDLSYGLKNYPGKLQEIIPEIITMFAQAIHKLYKEGARFFWVHNTGPLGCLPFYLDRLPANSGNLLDQTGCVKPTNEIAQEYNRQLKDRVSQLKANLSDATFTYVDVYSAKYALISNAKNLGFDDIKKFYDLQCGKTEIVNGTVLGKCNDPSKLISWDNVHYSEAANLLLSKQIINGSLSHPHVSIAEACHKLP